MKRNVRLRTPILLAVLASFTACSNENPQPQAASAEASTEPRRNNNDGGLPEVVTATPSEGPLAIEITAPGSFVAYEEATVSTETPGTVEQFLVKEGTRVRRGQVLVLLEKTRAELSVKQAEAALAQARANFQRAKSELERKEILLADRTISQGTFDTFKAQYDAADAAVDGAESTLALARKSLEDMTVVAPFSGVIKEKRAAPGEYVRAGDALLVLIQIHPIKLQFEVPEKYAARLSIGQEVRTSVSALPGETFTGKVATIFPALAIESRTIRVEAQVPNETHRLKPGFYASVAVPLSQVPGALVVPRSALLRHEGTENVFIVQGDTVERVPVEVGGETTDQIEILSGLSPTDRIIVTGIDTLRAGDRVRIAS